MQALIHTYIDTLLIQVIYLLIHGVLVLRFHEKLFDCCVSLEVSLYSILTTCHLETFLYSFGVWDDHKSYIRFLSCLECFFPACTWIVSVLFCVVVIPVVVGLIHVSICLGTVVLQIVVVAAIILQVGISVFISVYILPC